MITLLNPERVIAPEDATELLPDVVMTKLLAPPKVSGPTAKEPEAAVLEKVAVAPMPVKVKVLDPPPRFAALKVPAFTVRELMVLEEAEPKTTLFPKVLEMIRLLILFVPLSKAVPLPKIDRLVKVNGPLKVLVLEALELV